MTYGLKSEKSAKNFSYTKTLEKEQIFSVPCAIVKLRRKLNFFGCLYKNGTEGVSCGENWLLKRILGAARICNYLIYQWILLKESSIMFLVLLAVKELL